MSHRRKGFTLLELMIVVAIILILCSIAVPHLLHSKMTANEASALETLNSLNGALFDYWTNYDGYPESLSDKESAATLETINSLMPTSVRNGYAFAYKSGL